MGLADQLLKAGLVDKNKVKVANQNKSKQQKEERRSGVQSVDEARLAAQEAQRQNAEKARQANAERDALAQQKAIAAQIAQMVQQNKQPKGNGDIAYNFTYGTRIERIYVSAAVREHLVAGRLVIVGFGDGYELGPARHRRQDRRAQSGHRGARQAGQHGNRRGRSVRGLQDPRRPDVVISDAAWRTPGSSKSCPGAGR